MRTIIAIAAMGLSGCNNACQQVCVRMANYAEDCGITVSDSEIKECIDENSSAESDLRATCRQYGDASAIRQEWTCDELQEYWDDPSES